jgi:hypothetical protein
MIEPVLDPSRGDAAHGVTMAALTNPLKRK